MIMWGLLGFVGLPLGRVLLCLGRFFWFLSALFVSLVFFGCTWALLVTLSI